MKDKLQLIVCARCGEDDDEYLDKETRECHSCGEQGVLTVEELIDYYNFYRSEYS
jgi:anaerobic ribonucleoside-triphosphate reductase